jgi:hypothetical protein
MLAGFGLIAGVLAIWRRRASNAQPPIIEPPIAGGKRSGPDVAAKGRFNLDMKVVSVIRSVMMVTVKVQVTIANRSDRALRDLAITGDLVSASKALPMDQQVAKHGTALAHLHTIDRVGPHQSSATEITVQMPTGEVEVLYQGQIPMFVPLIRLHADCEAADPVAKTFFLGLGAQGAKLQPLPLNTSPGGYQGVTARPVGSA